VNGVLALVASALVGCGDSSDPAANDDTGNIGFDTGRDASDVDSTSPDTTPVDSGPPDVEVPDTPLGLRVLTFNVGRFFDSVCDSGSCSTSSFEALPRPSEFEARADQIARGIRNSGADIVILQEIENSDCLDELHERVADGFDVAVMGEIGQTASLDVAVLARGDLREVVRWRDGTDLFRPDGSRTQFSREFLQVELTIDGRHLIVFDAHFKSKNDDDPGRRLAEAEASRSIIDQVTAENPDAFVVFGGDLNDTPGTAPIDALEEGDSLFRVATELGDDAATYVFDGEGRALDHIFIARGGIGAYVPGTAQVLGSPYTGFAGSDHAALVADFVIEAPSP
jgi:predicted extracellular nuclease